MRMGVEGKPRRESSKSTMSASGGFGLPVANKNKPFTTSWHMQPTMAATEELSAPPESGRRNPEAPLRLK